MTDTASSTKSKSRRQAAYEERLLTGETVVAQAIIHEGIFWQAAAVFLLSIIVSLFVVMELGVLLAVVSVIMAIYAIIRKEILMLVLTNKRILVRYGMLQIDVVDIHFDKIESLELERMLTGYVMGYSNIVIMGTGQRYIVIPYVANGVEIRRAYNELVLADKGQPVTS